LRGLGIDHFRCAALARRGGSGEIAAIPPPLISLGMDRRWCHRPSSLIYSAIMIRSTTTTRDTCSSPTPGDGGRAGVGIVAVASYAALDRLVWSAHRSGPPE